jgi:hypothetical protein
MMQWQRIVLVTMACALGQVCLELAQATPGGERKTGKTVITFDEINAEADIVAAAAYLRRFKITISDVTPGTQVFIVSANKLYGGRVLQPSSANNVLTQGNSIDPVEFTLNLPEPMLSVSFIRPKLLAGGNGITFPEWRAEALDGQHKPLGEAVGEPLGMGEIYFHDVPAKTFTLKGPGIKAVRFWSNNHNFAAFSAVILDDLTLETEAHP